MNDFFGELAKKLAEQWLSLVAIPGLLFIAAAWTGLQLGHAHALDPHQLVDAATKASSAIGQQPGATQAAAVLGLLLVSIIVGLAVQALVGPVRAIYLGQWPRGMRRFGDLLTRNRRNRWTTLFEERTALQGKYPERERTALQQREIDRLAERINRIAMAEPRRPTWTGDRVHAVGTIAINRFRLDLTFCWPRLWLVLPDSPRAEIHAAHGGFAAAVLTTAWSLPYLGLGTLWWPAAAAGVVVAAVGWSRARARITTLTDVAESILDIHGRGLAIALGVTDPTSTGPLTPDEGQHITDIARKGR